MAAIRGAGLGLKVLLLERKNDPSVITRTCAQAFFTPVPGYDPAPRFYLEDTTFSTNAAGLHQFHFKKLGFDLDYHGPVLPMRQFVYLSPSGQRLDRYPPSSGSTWCIVFNKEDLIGYLLEKARGAGVSIQTGVTVTRVISESAVIDVHAARGGGETVYQARRLIAADGVNSKVVDSLGWNAARKVMLELFKGLSYIADGIRPDIAGALESGIFFLVPSIHNHVMASIGPYPEAGVSGRWQVVFTGRDGWESLKLNPRYGPWMQDARIVRRTAVGARCYSPLVEPAKGNVIAAGDSAAYFETLVSGALACGYQAANAVYDELCGRPGNDGYNRWWRQSFDFNDPSFHPKPALPLASILNDAEMDSLFQILKGNVGVPGELALEHIDHIQHADAALYNKLKPRVESLQRTR
jgi:flavin-dependent dehydrogenase